MVEDKVVHFTTEEAEIAEEEVETKIEKGKRYHFVCHYEGPSDETYRCEGTVKRIDRVWQIARKSSPSNGPEWRITLEDTTFEPDHPANSRKEMVIYDDEIEEVYLTHVEAIQVDSIKITPRGQSKENEEG
jgi:hypothetical protein